MESIFKSTFYSIHVYGDNDFTWTTIFNILDNENVSLTNYSSTCYVFITLFSIADNWSYRCSKNSRKVYFCWISFNGSWACFYSSWTVSFSKRIENTSRRIKEINIINIRTEESWSKNITPLTTKEVTSLRAKNKSIPKFSKKRKRFWFLLICMNIYNINMIHS